MMGKLPPQDFPNEFLPALPRRPRPDRVEHLGGGNLAEPHMRGQHGGAVDPRQIAASGVGLHDGRQEMLQPAMGARLPRRPGSPQTASPVGAGGEKMPVLQTVGSCDGRRRQNRWRGKRIMRRRPRQTRLGEWCVDTERATGLGPDLIRREQRGRAHTVKPRAAFSQTIRDGAIRGPCRGRGEAAGEHRGGAGLPRQFRNDRGRGTTPQYQGAAARRQIPGQGFQAVMQPPPRRTAQRPGFSAVQHEDGRHGLAGRDRRL